MKIARILARLAGVIAATVALASPGLAQNRNLTPGELALMPDFCQDVQTVNGWSQGTRESPRSPYWVSKMGRSFWDMHHYCWAAAALLRAKQPGLNQRQRDHLVESAIEDFYYVVSLAPQEMVLLPEIYYLIGDSYRLLGQHGRAIEAFKKARALKVDYWPAYTGHADVLLQANLKGEARTVLQEGLRVMPDEAALKTRLNQISAGGEPSSGKKVSKAPSAAATVARPSEAPAKPIAAKAASSPQ